MQMLMALPLLGFFQAPIAMFFIWRALQLFYGADSRPSRPASFYLRLKNSFQSHKSSPLLELFLLGVICFFTLFFILTISSISFSHFRPLLWWSGIFFFFFVQLVLLCGDCARQALIFIIAILIFSLLDVTFIGKAAAFNYDDDLAKYVSILHWIVETGAAQMGPLGPQFPDSQIMVAGIQAFYLGSFDLSMIAYWDLYLASGIIFFVSAFSVMPGARLLLRIFLISASMLTLVLVNPMYVNISPLYLGSALGFCGLAVISGSLSFGAVSIPLILGSLCSFLFFLKAPFFIIACALYCCLFVQLFFRLSARSAVAGCLISGIPFLAIHGLEDFISVSRLLSGSVVSSISQLGIESSEIASVALPEATNITSALLRVQPNFYGFGSISYMSTFSFLVLAFVVASAVSVWRVKSENALEARSALSRFFDSPNFLVVGSSSILIVGLYFLDISKLGAQDANLRYFMPSVIYLALLIPFAIVRALSISDYSWAPLGLVAAFFLGSNFPSFLLRAEQILIYRNQLSFPAAKSEWIARYSEFAFSPSSQQFYDGLQGIIPKGEKVLVHVGLPWRFDLFRNPIEVAEANGQLYLFGDGCEYLSSRGINYVIWQTEGLGVRSVEQWEVWGASGPGRKLFAQKVITFLGTLQKISETYPMYESNGGFRIIDVSSCAP